jgi:hypothetical protein
MRLPPEPYAHLKATDKVKLQSYVTSEDKDLLMTIVPNRDLYILLANSALKRTVDFIKKNGLQYNPTDAQRLINFIVTGYDVTTVNTASVGQAQDGLRKPTLARTSRRANARDDSGAAT